MRHCELLHVLSSKKKGQSNFSWDDSSILPNALGSLRHLCVLLFACSQPQAAHVSDDRLAILVENVNVPFQSYRIGQFIAP